MIKIRIKFFFITFFLILLFFVFYFKINIDISDKNIKNLSSFSVEEINRNDSSVIEFAKSSNNKNECEKTLDVYNRDICYEVLAKNNIEFSLCKKISDERLKNLCFFYVAFNLAREEKDLTKCEKIPVENYILDCKNLLEKTNFCIKDGC